MVCGCNSWATHSLCSETSKLTLFLACDNSATIFFLLHVLCLYLSRLGNNLSLNGGREQQCFIKIFSQLHQCFADLHLIQTLFQFHITSQISVSVLFRGAFSMAGHNLGHYVSLWAVADAFFYLSYSTAVKSAHGQQEFITFFPQCFGVFFLLFQLHHARVCCQTIRTRASLVSFRSLLYVCLCQRIHSIILSHMLTIILYINGTLSLQLSAA